MLSRKKIHLTNQSVRYIKESIHQTRSLEMSFAPNSIDQSVVIGSFQEKTYSRHFEYIKAGFPLSEGDMVFDMLIFVGPNGNETRHAKILKTVAYVIVEENEDGYIIKKWQIRNHKIRG